ncbi:MAG: cell division protein FtsZ [archaeon]|nr:cell division protein FtsZ [archaeon]
MQTIVNNAIGYTEKEDQYRRSNNEIEEFADMEFVGTPRILIVGCGGAGNNTATRMHDIGIDGVDIIAINTDKQDLDRCRADKKILVGKSITRGLGAGGDPEVGKRAAELARGTLSDVLSESDLVFVTAGMGGGTGTGVAPVVADIARESGAIVVGMVSTPFHVERSRTIKAENGLQELSDTAHTVIALDNNRLLNYVPNLPMKQAFSVMDQLISETVKGISDTITKESLINLDYADMRTVMNCGGVAVMLFGESKTRDKSNDVVRAALNHPLLDVDYRGATGCLVHITGGPDLTLKEAEEVASSLTYELSPSANVIWGARIVEEYEGMVRVMAIMTGVESAQILGQAQQQRVPIRSREAEAKPLEPVSVIGRSQKGPIIEYIR